MKFEYDVIVIGAGHAGCEAACASANLGSETLLITMDMNKIAQMSCNPAVGGIAKGQIVREIDALGVTFKAKAVVLTAGTFLNGLMHIGRVQLAGGRISEPTSHGITEQLKELGFTTDRMKTGTPVRIDGRTIKFELATRQDGENDFHKFSYLPTVSRTLKQRPCWIVYTSPEVHEVLREGLPDSPLYNGQIKSIGPRYCPSIETKIVTFADKDMHQLFLEPEGETTQEYYLNGFSSSLPLNVQIDALSKIPALSEAQIYRPGYAIEYDFFDPTQLRHTLETKLIEGLFFAGQVNGTTGYEEAAGQGLIAGINAHQRVAGKEPFVLGRDEAYIGVLIDDLVTKGVDEPYRMFTSRAEYRILLRQDDADMRLTPRGYELGLASQERYDLMVRKREQRDALVEFTRAFSVKAAKINGYLESLGLSPLKQSQRLYDLILRPQLNIAMLAEQIPHLKEEIEKIEEARREEIVEAAEILIKYQGYIDRERLIAEKISRLENVKLRGKINYMEVNAISTEARQKLTKIDPETVAQAARIPGISPSDINILLLLLGR